MEDIIIVGYGGHAKSVIDCIERQKKYNIIGYTDEIDRRGRYPYLGTDDVLQEYYNRGTQNAAICIGYLGKGNVREALYEKTKKIGYRLPIIVDPSAIISETAEITEGTFIGKGAIVNAEAKIGKMSIINTKALIEHECVVGDFVHIAVGAVLCGQVKVGIASFIGANATVIQCQEIGDRRIIPAGMTVR